MGNTYKVQKGDDMQIIANKLGTSISSILKVNPGLLAEPDSVSEGQIIKLPAGVSANGAPKTTYTPTPAPTLQAAPTLGTRDNTKYDSTTEGAENKKAMDSLLEKQGTYKPFTVDDFTQAEWMTDIYGKIKDFKPFSYDLNGDALYQQYKDKYIQQGKLAMADAMGQAAAMTGGYGSSYAQSVGQQQYQAQLDNLNDIVPELYQMALDRYNMDKEDLYNQYGLLSDLYDKEQTAHEEGYNILMDSLGLASDKYYKGADMFYTEQGIANDIIDAENEEALSIWDTTNDNLWEEADFEATEKWRASEDAWKQKQWGYQLEQDKKAEAAAEDSRKSYSGTKSNGANYNNGGLTNGQIKELQAVLGVTADGYYGANSQKAAGGLTAEQAYAKYVEGKIVQEPETTYTPPSYASIEADLNDLVASGASKSEIGSALRDALKRGWLTQSQYTHLQNRFVPRGYTY